jgi:hypothetical protein
VLSNAPFSGNALASGQPILNQRSTNMRAVSAGFRAVDPEGRRRRIVLPCTVGIELSPFSQAKIRRSRFMLATSKWSRRLFILAAILSLFSLVPLQAESNRNEHRGYYRYPAIHGDIVVFTAEGDLWSVSVTGGAARRLTSNPGREIYPAISPDGRTVAFSGEYEGPLDVYTMPIDG